MALTDNLDFYYDLSEASGSRVDSVGGLNLTDNNTVTGTTGPGSHNASYFTNANSEYLSHADAAALRVGDFDWTFTVWVNLTTDGSGSFQRYFFKKYSSPSLEYGLQLNTDKKFRAFSSTDGTEANIVTVSSNTFGTASTGVWYFLCVVYDSVANLLKISVNNGAFDTVAMATGPAATSVAMEVGSAPNSLSYMDGAIALFGKWSRVLSSSEITQIYNSGAGLAYAELAPAVSKRGSLLSMLR